MFLKWIYKKFLLPGVYGFQASYIFFKILNAPKMPGNYIYNGFSFFIMYFNVVSYMFFIIFLYVFNMFLNYSYMLFNFLLYVFNILFFNLKDYKGVLFKKLYIGLIIKLLTTIN